jgi:pSer/pThr/pTyr-binding forkhead associated (FHA) protein
MNMSSEPTSVDCPECGQTFDPSIAAGWCTNAECGEYRWESEDESASSDENQQNKETVTCGSCEKTVPDKAFCKECGSELGDKSDGEDSVSEPQTKCPTCDEEVQEEWSACPFCEESLKENQSNTEEESSEDGDVDVTTEQSEKDSEDEPATTDLNQEPSEEGVEDEPAMVNSNESLPEKVIVEVGDVKIEANDGDTIGRKVRSAHVRSGGDEDQAQYIHREHVRFEIEDSEFQLVNKGRNGTQINGEELDIDEKYPIEDGDTVTFSDVATGTVRVE